MNNSSEDKISGGGGGDQHSSNRLGDTVAVAMATRGLVVVVAAGEAKLS